jgi:hypothetical protein
MILSTLFAELGKKKIFAIRQRAMKIDARIVVVLLRKSAVRRTPKTVPTVLPPKEPASPPPLLDCIRTTIIRSIEMTISSETMKLNMFSLLVIDQIL